MHRKNVPIAQPTLFMPRLLASTPTKTAAMVAMMNPKTKCIRLPSD
jgi:hypothetical protein